MDALRRLSGFGASLLGTLGQLGVIAATVPVPRECLCWHGDPFFVEMSVGWQPYIDNEDVGPMLQSEPRCPGRQAAGSRYRLDQAPLPAGFSAQADWSADVLACARPGADGSVEAVKILAGTGKDRLDARLAGTIRRQWRFQAVDGTGADRRWQRIRLKIGTPGAVPEL